jgi:hypothetical protein
MLRRLRETLFELATAALFVALIVIAYARWRSQLIPDPMSSVNAGHNNVLVSPPAHGCLEERRYAAWQCGDCAACHDAPGRAMIPVAP